MAIESTDEIQALISKLPDGQREKFQALLGVSEARKEALYKVLNSLGDFMFVDRAIEGADFVDHMRECLDEIRGHVGLGLNDEPMVIKNSQGQYLSSRGEFWTADFEDAGAFFGGIELEAGSTMCPLINAELDEYSFPNEDKMIGARND